jgi:hypothetical protein
MPIKGFFMRLVYFMSRNDYRLPIIAVNFESLKMAWALCSRSINHPLAFLNLAY